MPARADGLIHVKFLWPAPNREFALRWLRQFPGRSGIWGNCKFIFDDDCRDYDWLVVYDDLRVRGEPLACPQANTLLVTMEPSSIKTYTSGYISQFGHILTGQEEWALHHPGKIWSQPALHWFYGYRFDDHSEGSFLDYDTMEAHPPLKKTHLISTVCSAKQQKHTMHNQRFRFIEALQRKLPELERFGKGIREINDKAEALTSYKYHIVIENHRSDHWWTEKLSDAFLGATLPFYFGAPNADTYFPAESFIPIDIHDLNGSLAIIKEAIHNNEYEKRLPAILEARKRVLERYNIFPTLAEIIEREHVDEHSGAEPGILYGRHGLRKQKPIFYIKDVLEKARMQRLQKKHYPSKQSDLDFTD